MKRKPIIAGNWKMFKLIAEAVSTAVELKPLVANANHCEIVIAPPFTALKAVSDRLEGSNIKVAAQDLAAQPKEGPFTGEVSGEMLREAGCSHAIIGHSERREHFGETDEIVSRKARAALQSGLLPIVCVGEKLAERERGMEREVVSRQIAGSLAELTATDLLRIIVAYEPVWAIGTGRTATPAQAQAMHAFVRQVITAKFGVEAGQAVRILYGGSVKPENIAELMEQSDIDGALVGGASLEAKSFARIVAYRS